MVSQAEPLGLNNSFERSSSCLRSSVRQVTDSVPQGFEHAFFKTDGKPKLFVAGGTSQRNLLRDSSARCLVLDLESQVLTEVAHMLQNRSQFALLPFVASQGHSTILALGGIVKSELHTYTLRDCESYDVVADKWTAMSRMTVPRSNAGAC